MPLPSDWRRRKSMDLEFMLEQTNDFTDDEIDDVITELAERDAQREADHGAMNGRAPTTDAEAWEQDGVLPGDNWLQ